LTSFFFNCHFSFPVLNVLITKHTCFHDSSMNVVRNPKAIHLQLQRKQEDIQNNPVLHSSNIFQFSEQCIFCEQSAVLSENRRKKIVTLAFPFSMSSLQSTHVSMIHLWMWFKFYLQKR
jgi:biotin synthase-like enzyme